MEGGENIFLVILHKYIATVYSTCPSSDMNCCLPGLYWNKDLNICTGCKIGFFGQNCASPCRYPNYGERCQQKCNCTQDFCDTTKECRNSSDCNFGYYGKTCSDPCRFLNYGERCQSWCNCSQTACNHITGCQLGTEIPETLVVWNTTSEEGESSFMEKFQSIIIIGGSIIFTFILIFVLVIITIVRKNKRSDQRKEFECNFDSEFSSCHSLPGDTVQGTCTSSARDVQKIELSGKSVECYEFEIYENTCIQGNSHSFSLNYIQ